MTERLCEELVEAGIVAWLPVLEIDVGNTWKSWKYHCRFSFLIDPPSSMIHHHLSYSGSFLRSEYCWW